MTGLPVQVFSSVVGHATQTASSGQTSGRGRRRQIDQAVAPSGIVHHRIAGTTTKGTNSHSPTGGERTTPASLGFGRSSGRGPQNGAPAGHPAGGARGQAKDAPT